MREAETPDLTARAIEELRRTLESIDQINRGETSKWREIRGKYQD